MKNQINNDILYNENFPRSNKYDPAWIIDNAMGSHPLWLTEFLVQSLHLKPGMRVLDLACGRGITSVFLAREFGVEVYSVDFDEWDGYSTTATGWNNAKEYGVEDSVVPIKADARNLPFAPGFFDAIVCINSWYYFGQDEAYLENILRFLRPGGQLGMIINGYPNETPVDAPNYLVEFLGEDQLWTWKSVSWYKDLWEKDGLVSINAADALPNANDLLIRYEAAQLAYNLSGEDETDIYEADNGEYMGFVRLVATKK